ncbi:MAG: hypothetical protein M0R06_27130 [Sphaerochaeta sp.]|nr:hypothetical protein [Sphaerochaeta sp.]
MSHVTTSIEQKQTPGKSHGGKTRRGLPVVSEGANHESPATTPLCLPDSLPSGQGVTPGHGVQPSGIRAGVSRVRTLERLSTFGPQLTGNLNRREVRLPQTGRFRLACLVGPATLVVVGDTVRFALLATDVTRGTTRLELGVSHAMRRGVALCAVLIRHGPTFRSGGLKRGAFCEPCQRH